MEALGEFVPAEVPGDAVGAWGEFESGEALGFGDGEGFLVGLDVEGPSGRAAREGNPALVKNRDGEFEVTGGGIDLESEGGRPKAGGFFPIVEGVGAIAMRLAPKSPGLPGFEGIGDGLVGGWGESGEGGEEGERAEERECREDFHSGARVMSNWGIKVSEYGKKGDGASESVLGKKNSWGLGAVVGDCRGVRRILGEATGEEEAWEWGSIN